MTLQLKSGTSWADTYARCILAAPEAFAADRLLNLVRGGWQAVGVPGEHTTPIDGSPIPGPPRVGIEEATAAVEFAIAEHHSWSKTPLDERAARVSAAVDALADQRDLLALLLVWEIGKPWRLACADVDRALDGVRWYLDKIARQLGVDGPAPGSRCPDRSPTSPAGTTR